MLTRRIVLLIWSTNDEQEAAKFPGDVVRHKLAEALLNHEIKRVFFGDAADRQYGGQRDARRDKGRAQRSAQDIAL